MTFNAGVGEGSHFSNASTARTDPDPRALVGGTPGTERPEVVTTVKGEPPKFTTEWCISPQISLKMALRLPKMLIGLQSSQIKGPDSLKIVPVTHKIAY